MAEEELYVVRLSTEFYRDGFLKVLTAIVMVLIAIAALVALSIYLFITKPAPIYFSTDKEWRIVAPVSVDQQYLSDADVLQWVARALPAAFTYDFLTYQTEQQNVIEYFTTKGWQNLLGQLNNRHMDYNAMKAGRRFVNAQLTTAPFILNEGLLPDGKYAWRVQLGMQLNFNNDVIQSLSVEALVVRIPTLDNLYGVAIDDMKITESTGNQVRTHG